MWIRVLLTMDGGSRAVASVPQPALARGIALTLADVEPVPMGADRSHWAVLFEEQIVGNSRWLQNVMVSNVFQNVMTCIVWTVRSCYQSVQSHRASVACMVTGMLVCRCGGSQVDPVLGPPAQSLTASSV